MRRFLPIALLAAASSLAVNGGVAWANNAAEPIVILSSASGAMLPPQDWNCDRYVDEYHDFLEAGNAPESWRFFGKRYRADPSGEYYDWPMWLEWERDANCGLAGLSGELSATTKGGMGGMGTVGIVAGLLGAGGIAAGGGGGGNSGGGDGGNKSPG